MATTKRVVVIAGVGNGTGTGGAVAHLFTKEGYAVALLARHEDSIRKLADELNQAGGEAVAFPLSSYSAESIDSTWASIKAQFPTPKYNIRVGIWNAAEGLFKEFLNITQEEFEKATQLVNAAFAFSKQAILTFKENEIEPENGKRGALIYTGATSSLRGNVFTSAFSPPKFALRSLSQSLNKSFGKENIHVAHVVIDGVILTDRVRERYAKGPEWEQNQDVRLDGMSIAKSYLYLVQQGRSAWTWELDCKCIQVATKRILFVDIHGSAPRS